MENQDWICNPATGEHKNCGHLPTITPDTPISGEIEVAPPHVEEVKPVVEHEDIKEYDIASGLPKKKEEERKEPESSGHVVSEADAVLPMNDKKDDFDEDDNEGVVEEQLEPIADTR